MLIEGFDPWSPLEVEAVYLICFTQTKENYIVPNLFTEGTNGPAHPASALGDSCSGALNEREIGKLTLNAKRKGFPIPCLRAHGSCHAPRVGPTQERSSPFLLLIFLKRI
jgi:hypothetical protein